MPDDINLPGLSTDEVLARQKKFGANFITEKKRSLTWRIIVWLISPMSLMFIMAGVLSVIAREFSDGIIILVLFITNVSVGAWHEAKADRAIKKLQDNLTIQIRVFRDAQWIEILSTDLVPGDVIELSVGDVIPADVEFLIAKNLSINESVVTGESLPADKDVGAEGYSGSFISTGLAIARVTAIGEKTYFGTTVSLVETHRRKSHLEKDILSISTFLSVVSVIILFILTSVLVWFKEPFIKIATFDISLLIAGIPVALPTVMTLIISVGVIKLSRKSVIVRRLSSLEDLANVNLLLSDKTGTLTENKIKVVETHFLVTDMPEQDILSLALTVAGASRQNPIDQAVQTKVRDLNINSSLITDFIPGDSERKRVTVFVERNSKKIALTLGAPKTIRDLSDITDGEADRYNALVTKAAQQGFRAVTLAISPNDREEKLRPLAVFFLADAVRPEAKQTLDFMRQSGLMVKIVTGDGRDVATQISKELGIDGEIISRQELEEDIYAVKDRFNSVAGFAEVLPKDKYEIVNMARSLPEEYVVAVTGDGVNDLPSIKTADVGIAVANAVDALKSTADIILTLPGIAVIKDAIVESRMVFARLYNYSIYRISESFRLIVTIVLIGVIFGTYLLTPVQIILIALLNDVPIISLAFDRVAIPKAPVRINPRRRFKLGLLFGVVGVLNSMTLLWLVVSFFHLPWAVIQTLFFLKLTVSGHMLVYVAHTDKPWYKFLPSKPVIWATTITQLLASLIAFWGIFVVAIPFSYILLVWVWSFVWMQIGEYFKHLFYK